jgi:hypothetical protein
LDWKKRFVVREKLLLLQIYYLVVPLLLLLSHQPIVLSQHPQPPQRSMIVALFESIICLLASMT